MNDETCLWCGRPATRLCDTLLHTETVLRRVDEFGREREPVHRLNLLSEPLDQIPTCDAPICDRCTKRAGLIFDYHPSSYDQRHETIDMCPYCVRQCYGPKGSGLHAHLRVEAVGHRERCRAHGAAALAQLLEQPDAVVLSFPAPKDPDV